DRRGRVPPRDALRRGRGVPGGDRGGGDAGAGGRRPEGRGRPARTGDANAGRRVPGVRPGPRDRPRRLARRGPRARARMTKTPPAIGPEDVVLRPERFRLLKVDAALARPILARLADLETPFQFVTREVDGLTLL